MELPFVDEHACVVECGRADAWDALLEVVEREFAGPGTAQGARLLGCADVSAGGPRPLAVGATLPGFHVAACAPPSELRLEGRHRFSDYALRFRLEQLGPDRTRVSAATWARFPGAFGWAYRALVIGTRGHVLALRRLLGRLRRHVARRGTVRD